MSISHVAVNPSEYRANDFPHPLKEVMNSRWQVDIYLHNPIYEEGEDDIKYKFVVSTIHITAYNLQEETSEHAYKFFIEALKVLEGFERMENPSNISDSDPFCGTDYDVISDHKGFGSFIEFLYGSSYPFDGLTTQGTIDRMNEYKYLFYSSLKLLYYPFDAVGVCGGETAFYNYDEWLDFVTNPPKLVEQFAFSNY